MYKNRNVEELKSLSVRAEHRTGEGGGQEAVQILQNRRQHLALTRDTEDQLCQRNRAESYIETMKIEKSVRLSRYRVQILIVKY